MLTLKGTQWTYESDLDAPPGRWSCEFLESGSTAYVAGESASRQGFTRVAIDVFVQGQLERLMEGVVREWRFREGPEGTVSGASGLDLKALLLDFKPTSPRTFKGVQILSNSTSGVPASLPPGAVGSTQLTTDCAGTAIMTAEFETFQSVAAAICSAAGFTSSFDCHNYVLGQDIVWETDRSANDVLAQIASPFNATEKSKLDVFIDVNNVVRFVERGRSPATLVEVDYLQLLRREIQESKPAAVNDVQVLGPTFTFNEPDCSSEGQPPIGGAVWIDQGQKKPYTIVYRTDELETDDATVPPQSPDALAAMAVTFIATTTRTEYYDENGKQTRVVENKNYFNYIVRNPQTGLAVGIFPKTRYESVEIVNEHKGKNGELTRTVRMKFVQDTTRYFFFDTATNQVKLQGIANVSQFTERSETAVTYDKGGDPVHSVSKTWKAEPPSPTETGLPPDPTGLMLERIVEERWFWSGGQRFREATNVQLSRDLPGYVLSSSTNTEPATGRGRASETTSLTGSTGVWTAEGGTQPPAVTTGSSFPPVQGSIRSATKEIKAGPDNAQLKFSFPVLGRQSDCEYFRQRKISELAATRYEASLELLPDMNVREGYEVRVVNSPTRWRTNRFYVARRGMSHRPGDSRMPLRCITFI